MLAAVALVSLFTSALLAEPPIPPGVDEPQGFLPGAARGTVGEGVPAFTVRAGYRVEVAVKRGLVEEARFMEFGDEGTLFVSQMKHGRIVALRDTDGDGVYDGQSVFLDDQEKVHGMDWRGGEKGTLWFSTPTTIGTARDTTGDGKADEVTIIIDDLTGGGGHDWRSLLVSDEHLWTSIGDKGNITEPEEGRETMYRYDLDGSNRVEWSTGIRNTEEIHFRPAPGSSAPGSGNEGSGGIEGGMTDEIWGVEHGSDWFGRPLGEGPQSSQAITDLVPGDELNHYVQGGFYGHPYLVANRIPRIEYQDKPDILQLAAKTIPPAWTFGAHWAANGWTFISLENAQFPADHRGDAFVACRGSWNRTEKAGYRVQRVMWDEATGRPYGSLMIVGTLGEDHEVLARPVDVIEAPDGSLLFSSDSPEQMIYRIRSERVKE